MNCRKMQKNVAAIFLEPRSVPDEVRQHFAACADCASELAALEATSRLLEEWKTPEASAFFDARLYARLRVEQTSPPPTWREKLKAWVLYSADLPMRHVAAGAFGVVLVVGGGGFAFLNHQQAQSVQVSAVVRDLQSYDGNAQFYQQLDALDSGDEGVSSASN